MIKQTSIQATCLQRSLSPSRSALTWKSHRLASSSQAQQHAWTDTASKRRATSLLEELFPYDAKDAQPLTSHVEKTERHVPKIEIDSNYTQSSTGTTSQTTSIGDVEGPSSDAGPIFRTDDLTVLKLRKASKNLNADDFRRIMPSAQHISGWTHERHGLILKAIRGRDFPSLAPNGDYYLVFSSPHSAQAYKDHVQELHQQSRKHTPTSSTSPILPLPPARRSPQSSRSDQSSSPDPLQHLASYALAPPTVSSLNIRLIQQPFPPLLREVVENSGYSPLVRERRSPFEVLFDVKGWRSPSSYAVRKMIGKDGSDRNAVWDIVDSGRGVRGVFEPQQDKKASPHPADPAREQRGARGEEVDDSGSADDVDARRGGERKVSKFVVSFNDADEARRFVIAWHRRDVTKELQEAGEENDVRMVVNAEIIW